MKFIAFYKTLDPEKSIKIYEKISKMKKEDYEKAGLKPVKILSPPYAFSRNQLGLCGWHHTDDHHTVSCDTTSELLHMAL